MTRVADMPADIEHTIGVAIAVPEPYATELRDLRASFGDPQADTVPTHLTLLPPQPLAQSRLADTRRYLDDVAGRHRPFAINLRGSGTFRPISPVVFVTVAEGIADCELLAESVCAGPLGCRPRFPYHPHVTVAHHLADDDLDRAFDKLADYACRFRVDAFTLYVHDTRAGWRPDTRYQLRQDPPGEHRDA